MFKRLFCVFIIVLSVFFITTFLYADPQPISNLNELQNMELDGEYFLANDINCPENPEDWEDERGFESIGGDDPFTGTFDGGIYVIRNLFINRPEEREIGLFGNTNGATIRNVGIVDANVTGEMVVGGLVGFTIETTVDICYVTGDIRTEGSHVGALIGYNGRNSIVTDCYVRGTVEGSHEVGGLIGTNHIDCTINTSFFPCIFKNTGYTFT